MRSPTRILAATTLSAEALVMIFAGLVAKDLSSLSAGRALGVSAALAMGCLVAAGMLRSRIGYLLGSALQVLVLCFGFWVHTMFFLGAVFAALWITSLVLGTRVEREARARWAAAENLQQPALPTDGEEEAPRNTLDGPGSFVDPPGRSS